MQVPKCHRLSHPPPFTWHTAPHEFRGQQKHVHPFLTGQVEEAGKSHQGSNFRTEEQRSDPASQAHRPADCRELSSRCPQWQGGELHGLHPLTQSPATRPLSPASIPASVFSHTAVSGQGGSQRRQPDKWERGGTSMSFSNLGNFYICFLNILITGNRHSRTCKNQKY